MLCDICHLAISDILSGSQNPERWKEFDFEPDSSFFAIGKVEKFVETHRLQGCAICSKVYRWVSQFEPVNSLDPTLFFYVSTADFQDQEDGQGPWFINIVEVKQLKPHSSNPKQPTYGTRINLELFLCGNISDRPESEDQLYQLDVELSPKVRCGMGTHSIDSSGSPEAMELVSTWSEQCLKYHPECTRRNGCHTLPTRVIDVGPRFPASGTLQYPRLIVSNGQRAPYACLSYRWSPAIQQYRTIRDNFREHLEHIPADRLPRTLQDSIELVRYIGIRYLWIDCLCIIQDDDSDWQRECDQMAGIFENSFITISALQAHDSRSGLFHIREKSWKQYFRTRDGTILGLRDRHEDLENDVVASTMQSRGWILQEKILSPAIAHFGMRQMHWECLNSTTSEVWRTKSTPTPGPWKNILRETQRPGIESYHKGYFIAWYMIMQYYTTMNLTIEYDRLPAILGLAKRFEKSYQATFLAGLWLEDIHRGILWQTWSQGRFYKTNDQPTSPSSPTSPRGVIASAISPSWTWISAATQNSGSRVGFEWTNSLVIRPAARPVERLHSTTDFDLIDAWITPCPKIHRGAVKGVLQVWGLLRNVSVVTRKTESESYHVVRPAGMRTGNLRKRGSRNKVFSKSRVAVCTPESAEIACRPDADFTEDFYCYLLVVADWRFEDSFKGFFNRSESPSEDLRCFLLLRRVKARRACRNPLDAGKFERIGMGAGDLSAVDRLCGYSRKKMFVSII
jgi:hypothetical protein